MPNYMTELSPDNNAHVYQIKDKEAAPIDLLKDTVGWTGKNLAKIPSRIISRSESGITFTVNRNEDGEVTAIVANGTASADIAWQIALTYEELGNKILGKECILSGCPAGGSLTTYNLDIYSTGGSSSGGARKDIGNGSDPFTLPADATGGELRIVIKSGTVCSNLTFCPMIRLASILDSTYEPYHPSVEQTLRDAEVIEGKNLFNPVEYKDNSGVVSIKQIDGSILSKGTITGANYQILSPTDNLILPNGSYKIALKSTDTTHYMRASKVKNGTWSTMHDLKDGEEKIITLDGTEQLALFFIGFTSGNTVNATHKVLLCSTDESSDFEPYYIPLKDSKFDRAEQSVLGAKNFLSYPYSESVYELNGVTFTCNLGGIVKVHGTASAITTCYLKKKANAYKVPAGRYVLSCQGLVANLYCKFEAYNGDTWVKQITQLNDTTSSEEISLDFNGYDRVVISLVAGSAFTQSNDITVYPMLRLASDPDDTYVPYAMTNKELTDMMTVQESAVTDIISGASVYTDVGNHLQKYGKIVELTLGLTALTAAIWANICQIPSEYRPKYDVWFLDSNQKLQFIAKKTGGIATATALNNQNNVYLHATWLTN